MAALAVAGALSTLGMQAGGPIPTPLDGPTVAEASSNHWCWCTDYIKNRYGLRTTADAKNMGPLLKEKGFHQLSASQRPLPGDVVIISPAFFPASYGAAATAGHIAVV